MRVGLVQMRSGRDPGANVGAARILISRAVAQGAHFVATPEMTLRCERDRAALQAGLESGADLAGVAAFGAMAAEFKIWLLLGSAAIPGLDGKARNRSYLFDPRGECVVSYDKIHLFDVDLPDGQIYRESDFFAPGSQARLAQLDWMQNGASRQITLGLSICYDLRFPELYRQLTQAGAQCLLVPSAFTRPTGQAHWQTLLRARAIENAAFVLAPAQGGEHEDKRNTFGRTLAFDPWGECLGILDHEEPDILMVDLDLDRLAKARRAIPAFQGPAVFAVRAAPDKVSA